MVGSSHLRKTPTKLSVRADLVGLAKDLGLNLSEVLEAALEQVVKEAEGRSWVEEHRDAIEEYNAHVAKRGVFGDGRRRF